MYYDKLPEGASKRYRVRVPDGSGGFKSLSGYAITGGWRTGPNATPTNISGTVETDTRYGYVDLLPTHTATPATMYLDLIASLGNTVHIATVRVTIADR